MGSTFNFHTATANTAAVKTAGAINYNISAELGDNQIKPNIGYYDLKVDPGQKEAIKFKINNNDAITHTYKVQVNRATTDANGVIVYNMHNVKPDIDLKYDIEKLVSYPKEVTVGPSTSKEVAINITAPKGSFVGELLGGIFVEENGQINQNAKTVKGVTLRNKYDYVLGLQLQQNTDQVKPDLKFVKAYQTTNDQGQIIVDARMDNDVPTLEKDVSVNAQVKRVNSSKVILSADKEKMSMAPDSDFDFPVNVNALTGTEKNKRLKPGTYTMYLSVRANNNQNKWDLKRNFVVSKSQNNRINKKTPDRSKDIWIILGGIAVLIIIAGSVIFVSRKHKR